MSFVVSNLLIKVSKFQNFNIFCVSDFQITLFVTYCLYFILSHADLLQPSKLSSGPTFGVAEV